MFRFTLAMLGVAAAAHNYEIGIQASDSEVHPWGQLSLDPASPAAVASFVPSDATREAPRQGCIGVVTNGKFECHTLFKKEPGSSRNALKAVVGPAGELTQVQLAEGSRNQVFIEVPNVAPRPNTQRPVIAEAQKDKKGSKNTVHQKWQQAKGESSVELDEEEEKTFLQKYWIYIVPAGLVLISNAMGRGATA